MNALKPVIFIIYYSWNRPQKYKRHTPWRFGLGIFEQTNDQRFDDLGVIQNTYHLYLPRAQALIHLKADQIKHFVEDIGEANLLINFTGEISEQKVNTILTDLEAQLEQSEPEFKKQRKVYNILVETLQNLYHHTGKQEKYDVSGGDTNRDVAFVIGKSEEKYSILAANYINNKGIDQLRQRLEKINAMDKDELRVFYKEVLNNGEYSVHGGGGLGMIDIARKSGNKLLYKFDKVNDDYSLFILKIKV